jgi:copper chaperone CopZ
MMQDIGKWLVMGLLVAGLITVFVPDTFFALFADSPLLSMLLVLVCAIPMYLCATGSIPIAVALMLKGLSPGTALVLLMAGPAVNVASLLVISKVMGRRTLLLYLLAIVGGALTFGLGIDYLLPETWFATPLAEIHTCGACEPSTFNLVCTIVLALLLANALIRRYTSHEACTCGGACQCKAEAEVCACSTQTHTTMKIQIKGMSCNHCKASAERAIRGVSGVTDVSIDLASGEAIITGTPNLEAIISAVEALGFEVVK